MSSYDAAPGMVDLSTPPPAAPPGSQHFPQEIDLAAAAHDDAAVQMQTHHGLQDEQHTQQQSEDYLTASLKQQLLSDVATFFQAEIGPRTLAISEDVNSLQYEAEQLANKAATEKAEVLGELDRLHKLVASFQAQIREALMAE
ncbi:hypothetical protein OEZ85_002831 [Tetradesmus obliquus]|uniref:Uncharacterized protein n=2 Tax=Tetradesmus obliquus TaxID=3088 RepID=A0A383WB06_TETOB|nr:hypothetical protein OEZ85_002831 [Tetradesmus obliquus]|eukprot:jgi/Sobl393_1/19348/SZX76070.1